MTRTNKRLIAPLFLTVFSFLISINFAIYVLDTSEEKINLIKDLGNIKQIILKALLISPQLYLLVLISILSFFFDASRRGLYIAWVVVFILGVLWTTSVIYMINNG